MIATVQECLRKIDVTFSAVGGMGKSFLITSSILGQILNKVVHYDSILEISDGKIEVGPMEIFFYKVPFVILFTRLSRVFLVLVLLISGVFMEY